MTSSLLVIYFFLLIIALNQFIVPGLNDQNDLRLWADSVHYMKLAETKLQYGSDADFSFFSIPTILTLLENNLYLVFALNTLLFLIAYRSLCYCFDFNKKSFLFWIFINPMFVFALLTPNKEIFAFSAVATLNCFIKTKKYFYLILAGSLCLFARGQLFFISFLFLFLTSRFYTFYKIRRDHTLIIFVLLLSVLYPFFSDNWIDEETKFALNYYFDILIGSGAVVVLYDLQTKGLFFAALIPKLLLNLFGNLPKVKDCFIIPLGLDGKVNLYSSWANVGHEICLLVLMWASFIKDKFHFNLNNDFTYYACLNMIFFAITPFIQPRYTFPVYVTFVLQYTQYTIFGKEFSAGSQKIGQEPINNQ